MSPNAMNPAMTPVDIPVSFRKLGWVAIAITVIVLGALFGWGAWAPLNSGAVAPGEIIPAGHTKTLQHLEGGIIRAIHVKDGDRVSAGQEMIQLDDTEARAQLAIVTADEAAQQALVDRLTAERDGKPLPRGGAMNPSVEAQWRIFEARRQALVQEIDGAERRIRDARLEQTSWEAKRPHLQAMSANAAEEMRINQDLYDRKFIALPRLLELKGHQSATAAAIAENTAESARAGQKITEGEIAIAKLRADWLNSILDELRKAQDALTPVHERVQVARARLERTRIVAPQAGTVNGLRFMTVGGVIPPGGVVLEVTPTSVQLVVEARLSPDDIDTVHAGLPVRVRLTAYKARWNFALQGEVTQVSSDTFKDEKSGSSYYKVRVEIPQSEVGAVREMSLTPGMLAQVEIVTGERSALRYLFDPVLQSMQRAFKEE